MSIQIQTIDQTMIQKTLPVTFIWKDADKLVIRRFDLNDRADAKRIARLTRWAAHNDVLMVSAPESLTHNDLQDPSWASVLKAL